MKKLQKILTLCLALVLMFGIAAMPASAIEQKYIVWTEDEFRDPNVPIPVSSADEHFTIYVVPKDYIAETTYNTLLDLTIEYWIEHRQEHKQEGNYASTSFEITNLYRPDSKSVMEAAWEAYNRNTDPTWKKIIADTFNLDVGTDDSAANITEESVYQTLIGLKSKIPEGTSWTEDNNYSWWGGTRYSSNSACAAFVTLLSDAAFGKLPGRQIDSVSFSDVRVGDILRINNDIHSVIVLEVKADSVVIAEGNYNKRVHWGRTLSKAQVEAADYMITRWPENPTPAPTPIPAPAEAPSAWAQAEVAEAIQSALVPSDIRSSYTSAITREEFCRLMVALVEANSGKDIASYVASKGKSLSAPFTDTSAQEVKAAYALGIVKGVSATTFNPGGSITRQEAAAMLERTAKLLGLSSGSGVSFSDSGNIAAWATDSVAFVSGLTDPTTGGKVMGGVGGNSFDPLGTYTREQAIATALRLFHCAA